MRREEEEETLPEFKERRRASDRRRLTLEDELDRDGEASLIGDRMVE